MRALWLTLLVAVPAIASAPGPERPARWVWAGTPTPRGYPGLLYMHQGEVSVAGRRPRLARQGLHPSSDGPREVFLVFRLRALPDPTALWPLLAPLVADWRLSGSAVRGVQLDFDSATARLAGYAQFLRSFRQALPRGLLLSVTGLADWASSGRPGDLEALSGSVDEIVYQLYRGRAPVRDLDRQLEALSRISADFKIGILDGMTTQGRGWDRLYGSPRYHGTVLFPNSPLSMRPSI